MAVNDLRDFHRFVGEMLGNNGGTCSPEEALDEWRRLYPDHQTAEEDLAAVKEALEDVANGDVGIPFEEFDRAFRERHNIPQQP